jgi:neutral ceramidase
MQYYEFPHPNGSIVSTCPAAYGYGFAGGTSDWPGNFDFKQGAADKPNASPLWGIASGLLKMPNAKQRACHGHKPILLDVGEMYIPYTWIPNIVDMQLLRAGNLILIVSPGEATTMSGRRWKAAISKAAIDNKLLAASGSKAPAQPIVLLGGIANTYSHYIATEEEYQVQRYEGGSTLYGPHTLNAYINLTVTALKHLADSSPSVATINAGPQPPIFTTSSINLIPGIPTDITPESKKFGDVLKAPAAQYKRGDRAVATFVGASPRNNYRLEGTFAAVQISTASSGLQARDQQWKTVLDDYDWDLVIQWQRTKDAGKPSEAEITWEIGSDVKPGTYRLLYNGDSKNSSGDVTPFQGISPSFAVV